MLAYHVDKLSKLRRKIGRFVALSTIYRPITRKTLLGLSLNALNSPNM